jgi:hypothetical protein
MRREAVLWGLATFANLNTKEYQLKVTSISNTSMTQRNRSNKTTTKMILPVVDQYNWNMSQSLLYLTKYKLIKLIRLVIARAAKITTMKYLVSFQS